MHTKKRILVLAGTRPEAVKMAPVIKCLRGMPGLDVTVCASGQHREILAQAFADFAIKPDMMLDVMTQAQSLAELSSRLFIKIDALLEQQKPDWLLVQGDTTTVMIAALCAFYRNINIGHVEAGLRSFNIKAPFPEELNRKVAAMVVHTHFAPTATAKTNLLREGIPEKNIIVTGNTIVDALHDMLTVIKNDPPEFTPDLGEILHGDRQVILVTAHRRENHGQPIENICHALLELARQKPQTRFIYPVHPNPAVHKPAYAILSGQKNILLTESLPYKIILAIMEKATLIITDSGGIQEEGCILRKPVLVLRDTTERMEGIMSGAAKLVGSDMTNILNNARNLLNNPHEAGRMREAAGELYGDGRAASRIADYILHASPPDGNA